MSYNAENYRRVREAFEEKRLRAVSDAQLRLNELHSRSPEAAQLDLALQSTGMQIFKIACTGGADLERKIAEAKGENSTLRSCRARLLQTLGLPEDYTDVHYECPVCCDSGFVGTQMCECMRRALIYEGFRSSGIGALSEKQSFENFSLEYYRENEDTYERMKYALSLARSYADDFSLRSGNLLFMGGTGLGKTHLSTSIAKAVIERGYDVVYESAQNMMSDFEYDRFRRSYSDSGDGKGEKYLSSELLIIDDLGTEIANSFTLNCLYNVINTRINQGKPTVISTNLTHRGLSERYDDRITSRLLGEFRIVMFVGKDVRMQKL